MAIPKAEQQVPGGTGDGPWPVTSPRKSGTRETHLVRRELPGIVGASKGLASLGPRKEISGKDLN